MIHLLLDLLIYPLLFVLVALVAGNNLSACSGAIISGGVVDRKTGISIAIFGYAAGFLLQGGLLKAGLTALMPVQSEFLIVVALSIALVIFLISHLLKVPQSLSITFAMVLVGIGFGYGKPPNLDFVSSMVGFWIFSTVLAGIAVIVAMRSLRNVLSKTNIWNAVGGIKLLLIVFSFFTAFVLGANTIGFLFASISGITDALYATIITLAAILLGSIFLSRGELKMIGSGILPLRYLNALVSQATSVIIVEIATLFSIPASNTQTFTASLYGAGISYRTRLIRRMPMLMITLAWVSTALASLLLGFFVTLAIYHL